MDSGSARYIEESDDDDSDASGSGSSTGSEAGGNRGGNAPPPPPLKEVQTVLNENTPGQNGNRGLMVGAAVVRGPAGKIGMQTMVRNKTNSILGGWAVQVNKN